MDIYPLGTAAAATNLGTVDSISYGMFEPNSGCSGDRSYNILTTVFQKRFLATRKKAETNYMLTYKYSNIWDREFRQIEHFVDDKDESLTSFWAIDFSRGRTPSSVTASGGDWVVAIDDTRYFSTVTNQKSHKAFLWTGSLGGWKEGDIDGLVANTKIIVDVDTDNYGGLSVSSANTSSVVYPIYEVHANPNSLTNFKEKTFFKDTINLSNDGGWIRSGEISFICKYKV